MAIRHQIWTVGTTPSLLSEARLPSEALLEEMIISQPQMLSDQWMIIGKQELTGLGGRIDLLAIAPDSSLILIELKRDRTPREVVAQTIDYATWVEKLTLESINKIYTHFSKGRNLEEDFRARFETSIDEINLEQSHQLVIVATSLDASSERIVNYLANRGIAINVLFFQVFNTDSGQLISRDWLMDPEKTQTDAIADTAKAEREPWNGEYYVSFGHSEARSWEEARQYGFICGGGGSWYSGTLRLLKERDRVWVNVPGSGFVGVGIVQSESTPLVDFVLDRNDGTAVPAQTLLSKANYHLEFIDNPDRCEYFVRVRWIATVPLDHAIQEVGMFGNQNTVCAPKTPKWRHTVDRLKLAFPNWANND